MIIVAQLEAEGLMALRAAAPPFRLGRSRADDQGVLPGLTTHGFWGGCSTASPHLASAHSIALGDGETFHDRFFGDTAGT